jgi:hypothetical protein
VVNIGIGGLDTNGEFQTMLRFIDQSKIKPHTIVLQYFGNDIEKTAKQKGIIFKGFSSYAEIPGPLLPIVKGSYLFNYLYWYFPKPYEVPYTDFLTAAFNNDEVFAKHVDDLRLFIDYARRNEAKLLVLVFPFMDNLDMSRTMYVDKIINYFKRNSVTVIDVSDAVKQLSLRERIVNFNDGHASAEANGLVAREILKQLSLN